MQKKVKREYSAGGLVYRDEPEGRLWLVIKPTGRKQWRLPKGWIESAETSVQAAQREVREEGGVETEVVAKVGQESFFFVQDGQKIFKTVTFFLMRYVQEAQEPLSSETESIEWLPFAEARQRLAFEKEKEILDKGRLQLESLDLQPKLL